VKIRIIWYQSYGTNGRRKRGGYQNCRFSGRGNEPYPRDVKIASLKQRIQELERRHEKTRSKRASKTLNGETLFTYVCGRGNHRGGVRKETLCRIGLQVGISECVGKVPSNYHGSLCSLRMRVSSPVCVDKAPYYPTFHGDHHDNPYFQEEPIMLLEEESCPVYDADNVKEEDGDKDEVVYANRGEDLVTQRDPNVAVSKTDDASWLRNNILRSKCTSKGKVCSVIVDGGSCENMVATSMAEKLGLDVEDHPAPYQLTWLKKGNVVKVSKRCLVHFLSGKNIKKGI
nr:reverse transcriptase domain-containing protein [Tanacetum cinerariifolium]